MMDWADEWAKTVILDSSWRPIRDYDIENIATALRKARAEGYAMGFNETAEWMKQECESVLKGGEYAPDPFVVKVMARIAEIEKGNA